MMQDIFLVNGLRIKEQPVISMQHMYNTRGGDDTGRLTIVTAVFLILWNIVRV